MLALQFSGRRIKRPEQGLLAMHPFVDVLEGRNLFTATLHDGMLNVTAVIDAPVNDDGPSPWSDTHITSDELSPDDAAGTLGELLSSTTPGHIAIQTEAAATAFSTTLIGDNAQTLFGNALHDRRGRFESPPLPTDEQVSMARENMQSDNPFRSGRPLTGAMGPYLTMTVEHETHPFAL